MAALSYGRAAVLIEFATRKGITYPLLSDPESKVIRAFGILNEQFQPSQIPFGVPYPGTCIIDERGIVRRRFFETDYTERYTAASILVHHCIKVTKRRTRVAPSGSDHDHGKGQSAPAGDGRPGLPAADAPSGRQGKKRVKQAYYRSDQSCRIASTQRITAVQYPCGPRGLPQPVLP
jgi:hypothetical protein